MTNQAMQAVGSVSMYVKHSKACWLTLTRHSYVLCDAVHDADATQPRRTAFPGPALQQEAAPRQAVAWRALVQSV